MSLGQHAETRDFLSRIESLKVKIKFQGVGIFSDWIQSQ